MGKIFGMLPRRAFALCTSHNLQTPSRLLDKLSGFHATRNGEAAAAHPSDPGQHACPAACGRARKAEDTGSVCWPLANPSLLQESVCHCTCGNQLQTMQLCLLAIRLHVQAPECE